VEHNLIPNCPIGRSDILAAEDILGPNVHSLKGKTVRRSYWGPRGFLICPYPS
jgi:hypothetical protein